MINNDKYHLALSQFVDALALAEHNLKYALATTAGVPRAVAQAIFSGTNVDSSIKLIRRLYEAKEVVMKPPFEAALAHMKLILGVRNDIMHYGARVEGDHFTTSNAEHTIPRAAQTSRRSIADLNDMSLDLFVIAYRLLLMSVPDSLNASPEAIKALENAARVPWRYKSR